MNRADIIASVLRHPPLTRPVLAHELRGRLVQGLEPASTVADWTATVPQLADAIDSALAAADAATAAQAVTAETAGTPAAGHALVVAYDGADLVGICQCGHRLGRIRPGTRLDVLAVPWLQHTDLELPAARASA